MLTYELWRLAQAYNQVAMRPWEPFFNNPIADWMVDRQVDMALRLWFWPGYVAEIQDQFEQFQRFWSPTAGNLCKPR